MGNRLTEVRPTGTTSYTYNATDELTQAGSTTYTYDQNGNELSSGSRTFAYDLANRLKTTTQGNTTTSYLYDGDGKRLQASTGSQASKKTNFLWDANQGLPQIALERDGNNALLRRYTYGTRRVSQTAGSSTSYFLHDGLGSVSNLTSSSGSTQWTWSYEPFGSIRTEQKASGSQPDNFLKFTGEYLDPTGLYHLRARQYDPVSGRFLARDPVASPLDASHTSTYVYAGNRPTVLVDPSGRWVTVAVGAVLGGIAGGVQAWSTGEDWKGIVIGATVGAAAGAAAGALPGLNIVRGAGLALAADATTQTVTQLAETHTVRACAYNYGSLAGSTVGGALAAGLGSLVARETTSLSTRLRAGVVGYAALDVGLYPAIAGGAIGLKAEPGCGATSALSVDRSSGLGSSTK